MVGPRPMLNLLLYFLYLFLLRLFANYLCASQYVFVLSKVTYTGSFVVRYTSSFVDFLDLSLDVTA
jgi:hypothetical protein